ncbi:MAG: hypothetical protein ACJA0P_001705 [Planctomycetota bacterium]|jgi:hypothetical protein
MLAQVLQRTISEYPRGAARRFGKEHSEALRIHQSHVVVGTDSIQQDPRCRLHCVAHRPERFGFWEAENGQGKALVIALHAGPLALESAHKLLRRKNPSHGKRISEHKVGCRAAAGLSLSMQEPL